MNLNDQWLNDFEQRYERKAQWLASAPGRVNLIGEHTDYNGGFVLPAGIDRRVGLAAAPRDDSTLSLYSVQFDQTCLIKLDEALIPQPDAPWANYIVAVMDQFGQRGKATGGLDIAISGNVPLGAGLSSSAALEVAAAWLFNQILVAGLTKLETAHLAQAAEHSPFVGVKCGIMDQFAAALSEEGAALCIDCHSMDYDVVPFDSERAMILIVNSMKSRGLVDSEYNRRRRECEEGLQVMRGLAGQDFPTVRHIPLEVFKRHEAALPEEPRRRLRHNLTENERVTQFVDFMRSGDIASAGKLLFASHDSLRDDYEVSTPELNAIVDWARHARGVWGCRLTGAGFGGCCVALVEPNQCDAATRSLRAAYHDQFGVWPDIYSSPPAGGVEFQRMA